MKKKRPQASASRARLQVLATGDERAFREFAVELLRSPQRLDREAALEALVGHPSSELRSPLRELFLELNADGLKRDQGCIQRLHILKILRELHDSRDADIAVLAADAKEMAFGEDLAWSLRANGLTLLAELAPERLPFYAIEHLDDLQGPELSEPANTAFQLLTATGNHAALYQWLRTAPGGSLTAAVFELFAEDAPAEILQRYAMSAMDIAIKREDEEFVTVLVETIVRLELETCYPAIARVMSVTISDELYAYLAMLLAGTNRAALLELLRQQLHSGRRPKLVLAALTVRSTPEQAAIVRGWEER